jgi:hypothetical protein
MRSHPQQSVAQNTSILGASSVPRTRRICRKDGDPPVDQPQSGETVCLMRLCTAVSTASAALSLSTVGLMVAANQSLTDPSSYVDCGHARTGACDCLPRRPSGLWDAVKALKSRVDGRNSFPAGGVVLLLPPFTLRIRHLICMDAVASSSATARALRPAITTSNAS